MNANINPEYCVTLHGFGKNTDDDDDDDYDDTSIGLYDTRIECCFARVWSRYLFSRLSAFPPRHPQTLGDHPKYWFE